MEPTLARIEKQGPTDVTLMIPEPLHRRLVDRGRASGRDLEDIVIRALDAYFATKGPEIAAALKALDAEEYAA